MERFMTVSSFCRATGDAVGRALAGRDGNAMNPVRGLKW
jgi:hypothetical protein